MCKGHNQIGLKILGAKGTQNVEKDPEMAEKTLRSVWENLTNPNDLNLNQSVSKGQNQIGIEILTAKDTKSLKIGPGTAEKSQG